MHPLLAILAHGAETAPNAPALLAPGRPSLSYGQLWEQAQEHAHCLRAHGIGPQDRIAIVLPNGPEMAASFLSAGCAAAAAPLNPGYTLDDFLFYLQDLSAKLLLVSAQSPAAASDAAHRLGILTLQLLPGEQAGSFTLPPPSELTQPAPLQWPAPEDTALLLHTSGTTSRPKLVPLSAANLAASARHIAQTLALQPEDRCLNIMPLFHIHGLAAALLASLHSRASIICTDGIYASHFFDWLRDTQPTWYTAVPTMHQGILSQALTMGEQPRQAHLRFIRSSSAALPPVVLEGLEAAFGAPVLEAYGMTEASHQMTSNPLPPLVHKPGSVGLPAGPEVAIMNEQGDLLPPGDIGEVVIRGPNVTAGYLANEEANRTAFTHGWFRTGDQGRFDEEGYLYLTGRLKELINRGGEKISPREIDEVLLGHPAVKQALAFSIPHAQLGEEIGAAVELRPGANVDSDALRTWVAERLPHFKVPRIITVLDVIPKGPTGKLQRIGLSSKLGIAPLDDRRLGEFVSPQDELEHRIADLWRELLPGARCGRLDRFEALGGDSLLAVRMLTELSSREGVDIPYEAFVAEGSIAVLARALRAQQQQAAPASTLFRTIKESSQGLTLFCFPGHDGTLLGLTRMAQTLDPRCAVLGLDLDQLSPSDTMEEHAQRCVQEILRLSPQGPYRLAGVCFGGCLAYEVAQILQAQGATVDFLVLIDTLNPAWHDQQGIATSLAARQRQWAYKLPYHRARLAEVSPAQAIAYVSSRAAAFLKNNFTTAAAHLPLSSGAAVFRRALLHYRPRPWTGPLLLLRLPGRRLDAPALGWSHLLSATPQIVDLPFEPDGALAKDSAARVATILNPRLAALAPSGTPPAA